MTLIGTQIGKISLLEQIGKGGMGEVYLGVDETLGRKVAVKAIRGDGRFRPETKSRFIREAKVLSQLEHPTICRVYEFIEGEQNDFLIMELVRGASLSEKRGTLNFHEKLKVSEQIAEALSVAHAQSIVHRDLKPENIMITRSGDVKVLDFGLARSFADDHPVSDLPEKVKVDFGAGRIHTIKAPTRLETGTYCTEEGVIIGTPMFMSPEQARGEATSGSSDMYSYGLLLQWLFSGEDPYPKSAVLIRAMQGSTRPVKGVDGALTTLINRLKSIDPTQRPTALDTLHRVRWIRERPFRRLKRVAVGAFVAVLILGTTLSSYGFLKANRVMKMLIESEARAVAEAQNTKKTLELLQEFLSSVDPGEKGKDLKVIDLLKTYRPKLDGLRSQPEIQASLFLTYSKTYRGLGLYEEARTCAEKSLEIRRAALGREHLDTIESLHDLAITLRNQGKFAEAERLDRECLEIRNRVLGEAHVETLRSMSSLGVALRRQSKFIEAERLQRQCLELQIQNLGAEHPETLNSLNNLAITLRRQNQYEEAEQLFRQCLEARKRVLGEEHPDTIEPMNNLALVLRLQGKLEEAEHYLRLSLDVWSRVLGEEHPKTLNSLNNVAVILHSQGRYAEVEPLFRQILRIRKRVLGDTHIETLKSIYNLGYVLNQQSKYQQSEQLVRDFLQAGKPLLGEEHPWTLNSLGALAECLARQNKNLDEAEELASSCVEISLRVLGEKDEGTAFKYKVLALVLEKQNRLDEAVEWYQKAARLEEKEAQDALKRLDVQ